MRPADHFADAVGEELYHSENGAPILLRGNISDIMPNSLVVIRDSEDEVLEWNPFLSLENGRVQNTASDSKVIWDFTHYPE